MRRGFEGIRVGRSPRFVSRLAIGLFTAACSATGLHVSAGSDASAEPLDAGPLDGGALDASTGPEPMPIAECALDAPTSTVAGETPVGFLDLPFAWAGHYEACSGAHLQLGGDPRLSTPGLVWMVPPWVLFGPLGYEAGDGEVEVVLTDEGGDRHTTRGTISVRSIHEHPGDSAGSGVARADWFCSCDGSRHGCEVSPDRRYIEAEVHVDGPGWDLRGAVRAPYCHLLHARCF